MQKHMKKFVLGALAAAAIGGVNSAAAYQAGDMIVRVGAVTVDPHEKSTSAMLNGSTDVGNVGLDSDTQLGLTGTYMITDQVGLELLAATPFTHKVTGTSGVVGGKTIATVSHLPPTLSAQYYFLSPSSKVQPYVGLGLNYTTFFDEDVSSDIESTLGGKSRIELDDSFGLAGQIGLDAQFDDHWALNVAVWYIDIDTKATIESPAGRVNTDVSVDPFVYMIGAAYKF